MYHKFKNLRKQTATKALNLRITIYKILHQNNSNPTLTPNMHYENPLNRGHDPSSYIT